MQTRKLTEDQRRVLMEGDTEAPFSGELLYNEADGDYSCAQCGSKLFDASTKFDSGSGWPSFYDVAEPKNVRLVQDTSHGTQRVEVKCGVCGGHLGHVFHDAPDQPTELRFCINSLALEFKEEERA